MEGYNATVVTLTVCDELSGRIAETVSAEVTYEAPVETGTSTETTQ